MVSSDNNKSNNNDKEGGTDLNKNKKLLLNNKKEKLILQPHDIMLDPSINPYTLENYHKFQQLQQQQQQQNQKSISSSSSSSKLSSQSSTTSPDNKNKNINLSNNNILIKSSSASLTTTNRIVKLTPLNPIHNNNNQQHHHIHPPRQQHAQQQQIIHHVNHINSSSCGLTDPLANPHGNLTPEELINIKIRKRNVCYVVGLPIHVANELTLRSNSWFGKFGTIATIAINKNAKSIQANSIPAHITYDNDVSALNAINFCNKFIFDDGRKLKATFGTQHYCRWFIAQNKKCTNVFCGFRHSWCRYEDIITQKDINDFKAIPAGAYTSRNIENQPIRSISAVTNGQNYINQHHHHLPPLTQHHPQYIPPQQQQNNQQPPQQQQQIQIQQPPVLTSQSVDTGTDQRNNNNTRQHGRIQVINQRIKIPPIQTKNIIPVNKKKPITVSSIINGENNNNKSNNDKNNNNNNNNNNNKSDTTSNNSSSPGNSVPAPSSTSGLLEH